MFVWDDLFVQKQVKGVFKTFRESFFSFGAISGAETTHLTFRQEEEDKMKKKKQWICSV